jgi:hypothetical protein
MKWILYTSIFLLITPITYAQEFNAGIVQGLWYSQDKVFADTAVRIYVAIRNNTGSDLTGTVEFLDGNTRIGRASVSALDGRIIESWVDWTPSYGEHTISASLSRTKLHAIGENTESIIVTSALAEDTFFVDYDTDDDGIGNKEDLDDDGDGTSDTEEIKNGTDPLHFDTPQKTESDTPKENTYEKDTTTTATTSHGNNDKPEGLEQYLTPSRADTMLSGITQTINTTKEKLDSYRHTRTVASGDKEPQVEEIEVNADGFGEITRSTKEETKNQQAESNKPKAQKPEGFLGDIFTFIGTIFGGIYTGILAILSFLLNYPILIQLLLLFSILFFLYKTAKKLGGRPQ